MKTVLHDLEMFGQVACEGGKTPEDRPGWTADKKRAVRVAERQQSRLQRLAPEKQDDATCPSLYNCCSL